MLGEELTSEDENWERERERVCEDVFYLSSKNGPCALRKTTEKRAEKRPVKHSTSDVFSERARCSHRRENGLF